MADFRVDIGLIEGPCHEPDIISEPWLEDELVVFAAPDAPLLQPVTLETLAAAPWILRERGSGTRDCRLPAAVAPAAVSAGMELGNSEAIKHAVRHGMGISCLSRRVIADLLEAGTLTEVPVPLPRLTRTLYRIHHRQKHLSKALSRFSPIAGNSRGLPCAVANNSRPIMKVTNNPRRMLYSAGFAATIAPYFYPA